MFSRSIQQITTRRVAPATVRSFGSTARILVKDPNRPNSERHAVHKATKSVEGGLDNQSAGVKSAMHQSKHADPDAGPFDTAAEDKGGEAAGSAAKREAAADASSENQAAQVGSFKDHRGGQQTTEESSGSMGKSEEAASASIMGSVRNALGMKTTMEDHKDNKTAGGKTYQQRTMHTSARAFKDASDGAKEDGQGSREPVDGGVVGEQNSHLKHKKAGEPDKGKGNAAENPSLPFSSSSSVRAATDNHIDTESVKKSHFHTSARWSAEKPHQKYVDAKIPEPGEAGYDAPAQAMSSTQLHDTPPPANPNLVPSSEAPHSSTGQGPPHPVTTRLASEGKTPKKNGPPDAEQGKIGLREAWKTRDADVKN